MLFIENLTSQDDVLSVYGAVFENTVEGLIAINAHGSIIGMNKACERIFGYAVDECVGQNISMLMPDPDRSGHDGYLANYLNGGEPNIIGKGREVCGRRKDGEVFPLDLAVARIDVKGLTFFAGNVKDITSRKKAEDLIQTRTETLERFAYLASHDLKEPLRTIEAFSDILMHDYREQLDGDGVEYLRILSSAAGQMKQLVGDVLEFAYLETEQETIEAFQARDVVDEVLELHAPDLQSEVMTVEVGALPTLKGNRVRFYRLMMNLISNAMKYRSAARPLRLSISADEGDHDWTFCVADNGIGIAPEYHEKVFDMFRRLHGRDAYSGTGIGLAICKKIVESWGGRIWVCSGGDEGARFYFTLPLRLVHVRGAIDGAKGLP